MTPRQATMYLMWCGSKMEAGVELTPAEFEQMKEARKVSASLAYKLLRIKPEDYAYTPGKGFGER